ncbi:hypothetical protein GCM10023074_48240 [Microbispora amethystogenes]|uniref:Uncharacterized protein n=1 Tax=Microbispora amethystogenes TaxID=1427754 RepID=A0ABQ4FFT8_9ACTN|nr:hypothetical protein Mam01_38530 [Microbispora amethystogenes]
MVSILMSAIAAAAYAGVTVVMAAPAARTAAPVAVAKAIRKPFLMVTPYIGKIEGKVGFGHGSLVVQMWLVHTTDNPGHVSPRFCQTGDAARRPSRAGE